MTVPIWPDTLPRNPMRPDYSRRAGEIRRRTQPDDGPVRAARRLSRASETVNLTYDMTVTQSGIFDAFFDADLKGGTVAFMLPNPEMDVPLTDGGGDPIVNGDGTPLMAAGYWLCFIGQRMPERRRVGYRTHVSFDVEVLP